MAARICGSGDGPSCRRGQERRGAGRCTLSRQCGGFVFVHHNKIAAGARLAAATKFDGAQRKSAGLAEELRATANLLDCHFFDAGTVTGSSHIDGIHLDADQHAVLGSAMVGVVAPLLAAPN